MGAVRMRVQTADKNTSNTHHSSPSINILWSEKLHVCKKKIHNEGKKLSSHIKIIRLFLTVLDGFHL